MENSSIHITIRRGTPPRPFSSYHTALVLLIHVTAYGVSNMDTVKSHFKAMGLYNFRRGFGWAYKRGGGAYIRLGL